MNYLAHLYLASDAPEAIVGSLMGDFVKGSVNQSLPQMLRDSIVQHRRIDSFTDAHPIVQRSKTRLNQEYRRYGGILIDMFYDHFLARNWAQHAIHPLDVFSARAYRVINEYHETLPPKMQRTAHYLVTHDLLGSYRTVTGIDRALKGVSTRLSRPSPLGTASEELTRLYNELHNDFDEFLPELIAFVDLDESARVTPASVAFSHRRRASA